MTTIRTMRARDIERLEAAFPKRPAGQYEQYHVAHMTDERVVLVAVIKHEDVEDGDDPIEVQGYITLKWQSGYTPFWQRNVPEIADLNVVEAHRHQRIGGQLIAACEAEARKQNFRKIGLGVLQDDPHSAAARHLYATLGYIPDGNGTTPNEMGDILYLWKDL